MTRPENHVNLAKLCVGAETVEDLERWQRSGRGRGADGQPRHVTRMWPKREAEILAGGSLYWVFKGVILARQRILALEEHRGADGIRRCALILDHEIHRTEAVPRRAFQGWRYLEAAASPRDLAPGASASGGSDGSADLPAPLLAALSDIGVR